MQRALSISLAMLLRSAAAVPATGYENGWAVSPEAVAVSQPVKVTLVVNEQGAEEVRRIAHAVSDPASPSYGEFLTTADLMALTAPRTEDMAAVTGWLEANGVGYQTRHSNVIASMAVSTAAKMFATTFHVAENAATGQSLVRAADYALPAEVEPGEGGAVMLEGSRRPSSIAGILFTNQSRVRRDDSEHRPPPGRALGPVGLWPPRPAAPAAPGIAWRVDARHS
jgi:subtilase family serine protease